MIAKVKTGFGYFKNTAGNIIAKAELPPGDHPLKDGYTYTEVADRVALDAIEIYVDVDPEIQKEADDRAAIDAAIEKLAIIEAKKIHTFTSNKYKDK